MAQTLFMSVLFQYYETNKAKTAELELLDKRELFFSIENETTI